MTTHQIITHQILDGLAQMIERGETEGVREKLVEIYRANFEKWDEQVIRQRASDLMRKLEERAGKSSECAEKSPECPGKSPNTKREWRIIELDDGRPWLTDGETGCNPDAVPDLIGACKLALKCADDHGGDHFGYGEYADVAVAALAKAGVE